MQDTHFREPSAQSESPASRILWALLIVATLYVCYFSNLGVIGFVGPDEPRYAWIARAMVETGDWVTPRLYGQPWFEKPVLYYWEAAVSFKVFGVSEAAARLPSAFSALLGTLALAWLAWRIYGRDTARWFLIFLPSGVGMIGFSHAAATDMPFAGMIAVTMVCAAVCLRLVQDEKTPILPRTPWLGLIGFGVFLGLAVLAKGPAAIILCGGAIFVWAMFTKRWQDAFRLLHPVTILAFCATALPWYVLCARRNPDFFRVFIIEHNFKRYLTPEFQHVQPFWYYVPVLLVAFFPWIGVFLWSAAVGTKKMVARRYVDDFSMLLFCWAAFCVFFFSTSHSKLPGYILPAFPAVGLLLARSYVSIAENQDFRAEDSAPYRSQRSWFRVVEAVASLIFFVLFGLASILATKPHTFAAPARALSVIFVLFGLANLILAVFGSSQGYTRNTASSESQAQDALVIPAVSREPFAVFACVPVLVAALISARLMPTFFQHDPSGRTIARELNARHIPGSQLSVSGMNRSMRYGVSFYLHSEIREWDTSTQSGGYLLTGGKNCEQVAGAGFYCEEQAFDAGHETGRFLYLVIPIAEEKSRR